MAPRVFKFTERLKRGIIQSRPNRFVMHVNHIDGRVPSEQVRCHCPVTGSISGIDFNRPGVEVPCLLSPNLSKAAKTDYTVQALSLDGAQSWFGINQNAANRYVEHFLNAGKFDDILGIDCAAQGVKREKKLGNSRIDFLVGENHYIEVKTPMNSYPAEDHPAHDPTQALRVSRLSDRLVRHYTDLKLAMQQDAQTTCTVFVLFLFDADEFQPRRNSTAEPGSAYHKRMLSVMDTISLATDAGVRTVQVNMRVDEDKVDFLRAFELDVVNRVRLAEEESKMHASSEMLPAIVRPQRKSRKAHPQDNTPVKRRKAPPTTLSPTTNDKRTQTTKKVKKTAMQVEGVVANASKASRSKRETASDNKKPSRAARKTAASPKVGSNSIATTNSARAARQTQ